MIGTGGPIRGRLYFEVSVLHPSALLLLWMIGVLGSQHVSHPGHIVLVVPLFFLPGVTRHWLGFLRRTRLLLLSLWLILAYHTPGEALEGYAWAPTYEGMAEANLHAMRLLVLLACVAWLFVRLGRSGIIAGLWGLCSPFARFGIDLERLVVRLSLVLGQLEAPLPKGAWRNMLTGEPGGFDGLNVIRIEAQALTLPDLLLPVVAFSAFLFGILW